MKPSISLLLFCTLLGCDQKVAHKLPSGPYLEFKVGQVQGNVPFKGVVCKKTETQEHFKLMSPHPLKTKLTHQVPAVLIANVNLQANSWSNSSGEGAATAFIPEFEIDGAEYPLMMVAQDAKNGSDDYQCTLEREGPTRKIQCANAAIRPWYSAGEVPKAAFRVEFSCPP